MNNVFLEFERAKERWIKDKEQLLDINKSIKLLSSKFDYYEKERKEKDEIIREMQCNAKVMEDNLDKLEKKRLTGAVL